MIKVIYHKDGSFNWGDYIAPVLVELISGEKTTYVHVHDTSTFDNCYAVVGSILSWLKNSAIFY